MSHIFDLVKEFWHILTAYLDRSGCTRRSCEQSMQNLPEWLQEVQLLYLRYSVLHCRCFLYFTREQTRQSMMTAGRADRIQHAFPLHSCSMCDVPVRFEEVTAEKPKARLSADPSETAGPLRNPAELSRLSSYL